MKAYKIWHDTKYFIHKDTTNELDVAWTENINEAKDISGNKKAESFFFDILGFNYNARYDALRLL